jgi:predicted O-methyltransferase YrrM
LSVKTFETDGTEALNCDITHGAFANPMLKAVLKKFGKRAFARSSACMEFEAFLKRINAGGKTCLEIGTYNGITAVVLSQFFENVICVSVDAEDLKRHIIKRDIVEFLGIKNITFHDCLDNKEKAHIIKTLEFDFAFSDGDHTHDAVLDFELVKHCGRVLQHEAWPIQASVWNMLHALPPEEVIWADHDCFAFWQAKRG